VPSFEFLNFCLFWKFSVFVFVVVVVFWLDNSKIDARPIVVYLIYGLSRPFGSYSV
jgi:hypothetical protein